MLPQITFNIVYSLSIQFQVNYFTSSVCTNTLLDVSTANGYVDVYKAFCSYHNIEASPEYILHLQRIVDSGSFDLELNNCPGIEAKSDISLNLVPVMSALRFNSYFRGLIIQDIDKRSELMPLIADVLKYEYSRFSL